MFKLSLGLRLALIACLALTASACQKKKPQVNYWQELPPGQMALRKIQPGEYPDFSPAFTNGNLPNVNNAIDQSLAYMSRQSSQRYYPYLDISHERAVATLVKLKEMVDRELASPARSSPAALNAEIAQYFEVYKSIGAPDPEGRGYTDRVLFTGYYTPIFEASLTRQGPYQYPLYRRPADLQSDPITGEVTTPYPTRREIEQSNMLAGTELVWLKDKFEAFIVQVQGSARLRLPDGRIMEVGYAGNNGRPYSPIGMMLVNDGKIRREDLNLRTLRDYFRANPHELDQYAMRNERYVFFTESSGGPFGSLNVPVTPFATIATDKAVYPRAMPAFLDVVIPGNTGTTAPFQGFMLDQDTGGAIRAAGRTDIYMGVGDNAERMAGYQLNEGELYYLAIKPQYINQYLPSAAPAAQ